MAYVESKAKKKCLLSVLYGCEMDQIIDLGRKKIKRENFTNTLERIN